MSLTCQVSQTFPVAVVSLSGDLNIGSLAAGFDQILPDVLAGMPVALVIDGPAIAQATSAALDHFGVLASEAAKWPGVPVLLCGPEFEMTPARRYLIRVPTLALAREALAGVVVPAREELELPPHPSSCARARDFAVAVCDRWGLKRSARLAELVISELVANGVKHAQTTMGVTIRRQDKSIEISVRDRNPAFPAGDYAARDYPGRQGYGLALVAALSDSWGYAPAGAGKVVWTRLPGGGG